MVNNITDMEFLFKALSYRKRLEILNFLFKKKEAHVCEIADELEIHSMTASRNLAILSHANLIKAKQKRNFTYYSINPKQDRFVKSILSLIKSNFEGKKYLISYSDATFFDSRIRELLENFIEPAPKE
ncbi:metalloregulator ArsR/SmtB family transcription factor [Candidatus Oleimmundimicrobium sp.]|uniref:ArsR/SmtB family transcription factor n=1 Tax=Candidatus Oleimmundimicrobium sp. TaxID=3060597 RepID=UPI0027178B03|nr:metalloregulator ArsR/SmtB family transcription factor [Candidatus Oleimmundimicrobium sp.]MDO8886400.1 metalloregulator ArsR/SmtB family transcription factor [Candidatus Oleimmundimicrobium sp.]